MHGFGMWFWWIVPIFIVMFLFSVMNNNTNESRRRDRVSAKDILDKRYAEGKIDKDEYHERLRELEL